MLRLLASSRFVGSRLRWPVIGLALALVAVSCTAASDKVGGVEGTADESRLDSVSTGETTTPTVAVEARVDPVPPLVASLTVEEKIGQLLMPTVSGQAGSIDGAAAAANLAAHGAGDPVDIVARHHLGGVIYLESNIDSAQQVRSFSRQLQESARATGGIGLLVAVDQEGGRVSRLSDQVSEFPSAAELSGDADLVRQASYITGQQVQQQGVNVVLAPVADVLAPGSESFIDDRSFGDDPDLVASMVGAAVEGLQASGVAAAVKHWPGHGATAADSHRVLPVLDIDRDLWEQRERVPFAEAVDRGVAIVLVGHLALPQFDGSGAPATVSPQLIDGLLRDELGFDGVVMTDALNMGAVDDIPPGQLAVSAVLAGADVILMPHSLEETATALTDAVADGRISPERLDRSVTRVLRLKEQLDLLPPPDERG